MTRNSHLPTTESIIMKALAPWNLGQKSRWQRQVPCYPVEWLEDRILLSHGGGGSDHGLPLLAIATSPAIADLDDRSGFRGKPWIGRTVRKRRRSNGPRKLQ